MTFLWPLVESKIVAENLKDGLLRLKDYVKGKFMILMLIVL